MLVQVIKFLVIVSISIRVYEGGVKSKLTSYPSKKNNKGAPLRTVKTREDIMSLAGIEDSEANSDAED